MRKQMLERLAKQVAPIRRYRKAYTRVKAETDGAGELIIVGKPAQYSWNPRGDNHGT